MYRHITFLTLAFCFILSSCAPAVYGSRSNAFDFLYDTNFPITESGNWYASSFTSAGRFDYDLGDIPNKAFRGDEGDKFTQRVQNNFNLESIELPEGWSISLEAVTGIQTVSEIDEKNRSTSIRWFESLKFLIRINVPEGTPNGTYPISVLIEANTGESLTSSWNMILDNETIAPGNSTI